MSACATLAVVVWALQVCLLALITALLIGVPRHGERLPGRLALDRTWCCLMDTLYTCRCCCSRCARLLLGGPSNGGAALCVV